MSKTILRPSTSRKDYVGGNFTVHAMATRTFGLRRRQQSSPKCVCVWTSVMLANINERPLTDINVITSV